MEKTLRIIWKYFTPIVCFPILIFISNSIPDGILKSIFTFAWQIGIPLSATIIYFHLVQDGYIKDYIFNALGTLNSIGGTSLNKLQRTCKHEFTLYSCHRCGQHHCRICEISQHLDCNQYSVYKK